MPISVLSFLLEVSVLLPVSKYRPSFALSYPLRVLIMKTCFFIAGADIKEMKDRNFIENYSENFLGHWTQIINIRKPIIAAVNGFAVS